VSIKLSQSKPNLFFSSLREARQPPLPPHSSPCPGVNERDLRPARVLAKRWRMQAVRGVVFHLDHKYKVSWECTTPYPSRISEDEGRKVEVLFRTALCSCFCCRGGRKEEDGIPFPYPLCAQMGARDEGGGKPFLSCTLFAPEWRQGHKRGGLSAQSCVRVLFVREEDRMRHGVPFPHSVCFLV
jgi:hypothetical protein